MFPYYLYLILGLLFVFDLLTKIYFSTHPKEIKVFSFLSFKLAKNPGIAFSLFKGKVILTIFLPVTILILCIYLFIKEENILKKFSLGLIIIGGLSNLLERIFFGKVTDFIDFHIGNWHYPTFNLADVYITLGIFLYFIFHLFKKEDEKINS